MALTKPPLDLIKVDSSTEKHLMYKEVLGGTEVNLGPFAQENNIYIVSGQYDKETGILSLLTSQNKEIKVSGFFKAADQKIGDIGPPGIDGKDGYDGVPGIPGVRGIKGCSGDKGDDGLTGQAGPDGDEGERGNTGAPGQKGLPGIKGVRGERGNTGIMGDVGLPGLPGPPGPPGDVGVNFETITICNGHLVIVTKEGKVYKTELTKPSNDNVITTVKPIVTTQQPILPTTDAPVDVTSEVSSTTSSPPSGSTTTSTGSSTIKSCDCVYVEGVWRKVPEIDTYPNITDMKGTLSGWYNTYGSAVTGITMFADGTLAYTLKSYLLWLLAKPNSKTKATDRIDVRAFAPYYFGSSPTVKTKENLMMCHIYAASSSPYDVTTDYANGIMPCTSLQSAYAKKPFIWRSTQNDDTPLYFDTLYEPYTAIITKNKSGQWIGLGTAVNSDIRAPGYSFGNNVSIHSIKTQSTCRSKFSFPVGMPLVSNGTAYKDQEPVIVADINDLCSGSYSAGCSNCIGKRLFDLGGKFEPEGGMAYTIYFDRSGKGPGQIVG